MAETRILPFPSNTTPNAAPIQLDDLHLSRDGKVLLDGVTLGLPGRGITALMGPNGAGKSLLLKVIAGILAPNRGRVSLPSAMEHPALVFQKPVLLRRTVRANLMHALKMHKIPRKERPGRLAELLVMADLARISEAPARALSGGEQQRLAMVRALAARPRLLLLDEPTASLDPAATAAIEALATRASEDGVKLILITHDRGQAARLADDIAFLHRGKITEHTKASEFLDSPRSAQARAYVSGELLL
ncbi:ATP-binding cassette domain-containing protein [Aliiroseovarius sp. YM-037]|uniref:ATP-binding cassette domain-containing protein n=1 Tax=Aliiroseovarius sp. YM-037 TaxID=3341728 RepID=UPI003A7FD8EE